MKEQFILSGMAVAHQISTLSHALRRQVGAVIIAPDPYENRPIVLGWGVNGTPTGYHTNSCEIRIDEQGGDVLSNLVTHDQVIHAEIRALKQAGELAKGAILLCTDSPCPDCWQALVDAGISHVYYLFEYHATKHIKGIPVTHIDPSLILDTYEQCINHLRKRLEVE